MPRGASPSSRGHARSSAMIAGLARIGYDMSRKNISLATGRGDFHACRIRKNPDHRRCTGRRPLRRLPPGPPIGSCSPPPAPRMPSPISRMTSPRRGRARSCTSSAPAAIAKRIEEAASASIFIRPIRNGRNLDKKSLWVAGSRSDLLGDHLVLIAPADSTMTIDEARRTAGRSTRRRQLRGLRSGERARRALGQAPPSPSSASGTRSSPRWSAQGRPGGARSGRTRRGPARGRPATDAAPSKKVKVMPLLRRQPSQIVYPVALVAGHDTPEAKAFFDYVKGPEAAAVFDTASSCCQ